MEANVDKKNRHIDICSSLCRLPSDELGVLFNDHLAPRR